MSNLKSEQMKQMNTLKKQLESGQRLRFENEAWCEENQTDDFRVAEIWFDNNDRNSWASGFKIQFNCSLIHSSKTFKSFEKRFTCLCEKWNLQQSELVE